MSTNNQELSRGLKNRHIQMIALGGAIGTGLFIVSGGSIHYAGPSAILSYVVCGAIIFLIMRMLGSMAVDNPVAGSFSAYAYEYLGEFAGFLVGWNYWFNYIIVNMLELTAAGLYMQFWFPDLPQWVTALVCFVVLTSANLINVKAYGEFEFWFTLIKVTAVIAMIVLGACLIFGVGPAEPMGFSNLWEHGGFFPNGAKGFILSFLVVMFTFGGIEMLGITAGEAENPDKTIPRAINQVIWRILIFYIGSITVMMILWPWNKVGMDGSPFVKILSNLGIDSAANILNVVVLVATLSVFNCGIYSNARMLYSLAEQGSAPKLFIKTNKRGVPANGILGSAAVVAISVLLNYIFPGKLFMYLVAIATMSIIITWAAIVVANLIFYKVKQEKNQEVKFKTPLHPISNYICLAFLVLLVVLMIIIPDFQMAAIIMPIWIIAIALGYKIKKMNEKKNVQMNK